MSISTNLGRRACLGIGLGLASSWAVARVPGRLADLSGSRTSAEGVHYTTVHHFSGVEGQEVDAGLLRASDGFGYGMAALGGLHGHGTVYRIGVGRKVKVMHAFRGGRGDGSHPVAPVIEADDAALYGVTTEGGTANGGIAFRLAHDTGYTILHEFGVEAGDGRTCWGGIIFASDGFFYGATNFGGDSNRGVVYRMDKAGVVTPLWQLGDGSDPAWPLAAPLEAPDGRLYGTTRAGGAFDRGTIYSLAKDGSDRQVLHSFSGADGSSPQVPLTRTAEGSFYGVTTFDGPENFGTVFRLNPDGTLDVLHAFTGDLDGREPNTELLQIEAGTFVGTTIFGGDRRGLGSGVAYRIRADGEFTRLHKFGVTVNGTADGIRPSGALLLTPEGHVIGTCRNGGTDGMGTIWKLSPVTG